MAGRTKSPASAAASLLPAKRLPAAASAKPEATIALRDSALGRPLAWLSAEIDLASESGRILLSEVDVLWPALSLEQRLACIRQMEFVIPVATPDAADITILPGGVVAMRSPEGVRVADPLSAMTFTSTEARKLKSAVKRCRRAVTLMHRENGVISAAGLPEVLAAQSTTILADVARLPKCAGLSGSALVQWGLSGATLWLMNAAPPLVALAVQLAGVPVEDECAPTPAEYWAAEGSAGRRDLLAPGLIEVVSDLLADEVSDELRHAVIGRCLGPGGLAGQIAEVLGAIPASFQPNCTRWLGSLPNSWTTAMAALHKAGPGRSILGFEDISDPHRLVASLREGLVGQEAQMVFESGSDDSLCPRVPVDDDAAAFLARRAGAQGRISVILECEGLTPADLYAVAKGLAGTSGATVTVAAPAWGVCHRITWNQVESGNAAWFGMGVGLDELEILADVDHLGF